MIAGDGKLRSEGGQVVIRMPVEIDITNADAIRATLRAAASHGSPMLIIDTTF
jgi:anti-anti-sigma regulatory factor